MNLIQNNTKRIQIYDSSAESNKTSSTKCNEGIQEESADTIKQSEMV